jgi:hypothetical protein
MKRIFLSLALWLLSTAFSYAAQVSSVASARHAQALLGNEVWSQVIQIENTGATKRYPRTVYALVFELGDVLWFYTDCEGSQYLSRHRCKLAADKANFGPLLKELHPGFERWSLVQTGFDPVTVKTGSLPNGCFIESVACLRQRLMAGNTVRRPRILCYVEKSGQQYVGHAVLTFETATGMTVIDPSESTTSKFYSPDVASNARSLGNAITGTIVHRALWVQVSDFANDLSARYAGLKRSQATSVN